MKTKDRIIDMYKSGFSSSGSELHVDRKDIAFILRKNCSCDNCGASIFDMYDFPAIDIKANEFLCEECEMDIKYQRCGVCDNSFEKVTEPKDHRFILSRENVKEYNMNLKAGLYQVLKYPFFYGDILSGFDAFFEDSIQLVKSLDIKAI